MGIQQRESVFDHDQCKLDPLLTVTDRFIGVINACPDAISSSLFLRSFNALVPVVYCVAAVAAMTYSMCVSYPVHSNQYEKHEYLAPCSMTSW